MSVTGRVLTECTGHRAALIVPRSLRGGMGQAACDAPAHLLHAAPAANIKAGPSARGRKGLIANASTQAAEAKWADGAVSPGNTHQWEGRAGGFSIFVNSHYDSGNIEVIDITDPHGIQLRIHEDPFTQDEGTSHAQWFYYRVTGAKGEDLTMRLLNAGEASYPEAWEGYKACASYDRKHWFRVQTTDYDARSGVLNIRHTPERDAVYYAFFAPYPYEQHQSLVAEVQSNDAVKMELLGETLDGHDLDLLQVGEAGEGKRAIWLIARQHPGESMAEWFAEGFLQRLLDSGDATSRQVLGGAVVYCVPNMNPDGTWRGHLRTNAAGVNLNREWQNPSPERSPEVFHVLRKMEETGVDMFIDVHGDEALPYNFIAGNEGIPSWDARLAQLQNAFTDAYMAASNDFQTKHGYGQDEANQANLTIASKAVGSKFDCLAFTLEMPFKDAANNPEPKQGWSPERAKNFGAQILEPIAAVLPKLR